VRRPGSRRRCRPTWERAGDSTRSAAACSSGVRVPMVTALDVTVSELRLEAFLPADWETAAILARRHVE
jgi:hypothetical protein